MARGTFLLAVLFGLFQQSSGFGYYTSHDDAPEPVTPAPVPFPLTKKPTLRPAPRPTEKITLRPTPLPTRVTRQPTVPPTRLATDRPTEEPSSGPSDGPSPRPTGFPTDGPSPRPTGFPTDGPSPRPTGFPTERPTPHPTVFTCEKGDMISLPFMISDASVGQNSVEVGYSGASVSSSDVVETAGDEVEIVVDLTESDQDGESFAVLKIDNLKDVLDGCGQIHSAVLQLYTTGDAGVNLPSSDSSVDDADYNSGPATRVTAHRMTMDWKEETPRQTYGNLIAQNYETQPSFAFSPLQTGKFETVDVTGDINDWLAGVENYGWVFRSNSKDGWDFASSEVGEYEFSESGLSESGLLDDQIDSNSVLEPLRPKLFVRTCGTCAQSTGRKLGQCQPGPTITIDDPKLVSDITLAECVGIKGKSLSDDLYGDENFGDQDLVYTGREDERGRFTCDYEGLLKFDLTQSVDTCSGVHSASLQLYTWEVRRANRIRARRVKTPWDKTSTWNTFLDNGESTFERFENKSFTLVRPDDDEYVIMDVTKDVNYWIENSGTNNGWSFKIKKNPQNGQKWWEFWSSEATLYEAEYRPKLFISPCADTCGEVDESAPAGAGWCPWVMTYAPTCL